MQIEVSVILIILILHVILYSDRGSLNLFFVEKIRQRIISRYPLTLGDGSSSLNIILNCSYPDDGICFMKSMEHFLEMKDPLNK